TSVSTVYDSIIVPSKTADSDVSSDKFLFGLTKVTSKADRSSVYNYLPKDASSTLSYVEKQFDVNTYNNFNATFLSGGGQGYQDFLISDVPNGLFKRAEWIMGVQNVNTTTAANLFSSPLWPAQ